MVERGSHGVERREEEEERKDDQIRGNKDVEMGELAGGGGTGIHSSEYRTAMLQRLNPTNPLRIVINGSTRVAASAASRSMPTPSPSQSHVSVPRSTPTPQVIPAIFFLKFYCFCRSRFDIFLLFFFWPCRTL